jgi:signal transduction histidine kinase
MKSMREEVRTGRVVFRPRARLLKLIGEELISDEVVAVTELVKNSHDADASRVTVEFRDVTGPRSMITVRDDGCGMNLETVLGQWMEPAGTPKANPGHRLTERRRRVLGEKGVGRFAVDKLGRWLELISRSAGDNMEVRAVFDWDLFDSPSRMLSNVRNRWETRPASEITSHGTILRITGLRSRWNERMFRRLCTRLSRLLSPFQEYDDFKICMESDAFPQYSGELRVDVLARAPYRIDATFDGAQRVKVNSNGSRSVKHLWNGTADLRCGCMRVRIFAFDLESDAVARVGPRAEVRAWLREWSGISVYRDGFRVWPYGEPHDDWLRLDQRRVNNPVARLSNNQVVGFVEISRDGNPDLVDQTNREGLIRNRAFEDIRRLLYFVLQILEAERHSIRHPSEDESPATRGRKKSEALWLSLKRIADRAAPKLQSELKRLAESMRQNVASEEARYHARIRGYSELAALGHAAAVFSDSVRPLLKQILAETERLCKVALVVDHAEIEQSAIALTDWTRAIEQRVGILTQLAGNGNRRRGAIDVVAELETIRGVLAPVLRAAGVQIEIVGSGGCLVRAEIPRESFHRIIHILVANSLDWLHGVNHPRIEALARAEEDHCEILFCDNGPGIPPELAGRVFEALFSAKEAGRGMGLTIARNIVVTHGGKIEVVKGGVRAGAQIRIILPRKRPRATLY